MTVFHLGSPDNSEGDVENDMLGLIKSAEWTEEPMDEGTARSPLAVTTDDASATNLEKKEEARGTEEK